MIRGRLHTGFFILLFGLLGCMEEENDLPSVEVRKSEAIGDLVDLLTDPINGWKIDYQPVDNAGIYFMVLQFNDDGEVRILSDVGANEGDFFDQTLTYRIDAALGLELILETYGVFHYLFELESANFGGEFEFVFVEGDDNKLIFGSKSDGPRPTILTFEPATAADANNFSRAVSENFSLFEQANRSRLFGGENPTMQLYFSELDLSVFWSTDLTRRFLSIDAIGKGLSINEIQSSSEFQQFQFEAEFAFSEGGLLLKTPFVFDYQGQSYAISNLSYSDLTQDGQQFCGGISTPVYNGVVAGLGNFTMTQTLFKSTGSDFVSIDTTFYTVNIPFIFDENFNQLSVSGSLFERLPQSVAFVYTYGFENDTIPENTIGFIVEDEDRQRDYYLREYVVDSVRGNEFNISLTDDYYFSSPPSVSDSLAVKDVVEEIFSGGQFYAYRDDSFDFVLFRIYNPCNRYEWLLVQ